MDLVAGVRKEGSRGGRANFKWEDVKDDAQRENYLGHSLMAPVGRWQKGRDLSWYAKSDTSPAALSAADARKEELRKIKEAEQDALSEALGYGPMPKRNANDTPLGKKEVDKAIKETAEGNGTEDVKGIGFGAFEGPRNGIKSEESEVLGGVGLEGAGALVPQPRDDGRRRDKRRRSRSRDGHRRRPHERSRSRDRRHKHRDDDDRRHRHKHRSRERSNDRRPRHRSRSHERNRFDDRVDECRRVRSISPDYRQRRHDPRDRNDDRWR